MVIRGVVMMGNNVRHRNGAAHFFAMNRSYAFRFAGCGVVVWVHRRQFKHAINFFS
jgi:hypothetical protein